METEYSKAAFELIEWMKKHTDLLKEIKTLELEDTLSDLLGLHNAAIENMEFDGLISVRTDQGQSWHVRGGV